MFNALSAPSSSFFGIYTVYTYISQKEGQVEISRRWGDNLIIVLGSLSRVSGGTHRGYIRAETLALFFECERVEWDPGSLVVVFFFCLVMGLKRYIYTWWYAYNMRFLSSWSGWKRAADVDYGMNQWLHVTYCLSLLKYWLKDFNSGKLWFNDDSMCVRYFVYYYWNDLIIRTMSLQMYDSVVKAINPIIMLIMY